MLSLTKACDNWQKNDLKNSKLTDASWVEYLILDQTASPAHLDHAHESINCWSHEESQSYQMYFWSIYPFWYSDLNCVNERVYICNKDLVTFSWSLWKRIIVLLIWTCFNNFKGREEKESVHYNGLILSSVDRRK